MNTLIRRGGPLAVALLLGVAGCQAGGAHAGASPTATAMTDAQILAVGWQYAQCLRDHGLADFPDPVVGPPGWCVISWPGSM